MPNETFKHINQTKEEIEKYLKEIKINIYKGNFIICTSKNNLKNREFIEKYNLTSNKLKQMLIELEVTDFCYSADDYKNNQERLYIFCREYELNNWGTIEKTEVYIKTVIKEKGLTVIISFHKPEKPIKKLFK